MKTTRPVFPVPPPPIVTPRLLLRPIQHTDLAACVVLRNQAEVMKWTSQGKPDASQDATQVWMNRFLPPNDATTFNFAVEERLLPGKAIGVMGCYIIEPPEVGYMFVKEAWGKGYGTEAFQGWLQAYWQLPRKEVVINEDDDDNTDTWRPEVLTADTVENNLGSARILAKYGFQKVSEEMIVEHGETVRLIHLELARPESW